ncbi:hypothetical protein ACIBQ1_09910 [Nonomuraea sp. NPDC050153]|uniref:hypothetical protein n=1 Tax=Nonomuraea sp. NPDC050153 TaxID=3364359 RepID=UPI00378824AD
MGWLFGGGKRGNDPHALFGVLPRRPGRRVGLAVQVVERPVSVRLNVLQPACEREQRRGLEGLLAPLDPQCVDDVELVGEREIAQP